MDFWRENVDRIIEFNDKEPLLGKGSVSNDQMEERIMAVYKHFDANRKLKDVKEADALDLEELKGLETRINSSKR